MIAVASSVIAISSLIEPCDAILDAFDFIGITIGWIRNQGIVDPVIGEGLIPNIGIKIAFFVEDVKDVVVVRGGRRRCGARRGCGYGIIVNFVVTIRISLK